MKKICLIVLIFALGFTLAACGSNGSTHVLAGEGYEAEEGGYVEVGEDAENTTVISDPGAPMELIDWMIAGEFSFDFQVSIDNDGSIKEEEGHMAVKDGMIYLRLGGIKKNVDPIVAIIKDGIFHNIMDYLQGVMTMPFWGTISTNGIITDYSGLEYVGSGTGEIDGRTLQYDEYCNDSTSARFYIEDGRIYGIESIVGDFDNAGWAFTFINVLIISNSSGTVSNELFEFPDDYVVIDMWDYVLKVAKEGYDNAEFDR